MAFTFACEKCGLQSDLGASEVVAGVLEASLLRRVERAAAVPTEDKQTHLVLHALVWLAPSPQAAANRKTMHHHGIHKAKQENSIC